MKSNLGKKTFFTIGLIALTISLFINYSLYKQLWIYYRALYTVELDPLGLSQYPENTPIQTSNGRPVIVFFGDSRAAQWPAPETDDFVFINRGIGNQTSEQVVSRFDMHVKPLQPDIVILQVCVNDLKTIPLFPEREQEIIADCEANLLKIIQDSRSINATVIITTAIPPTGKVPLTRRLAWSDNVYKAVDEVNAYILNMADEHVIVYDAANVVSDSGNKMKSEYSSDFLHLNDAGYQVLNLGLIKILEGIQ